MRGVRTALAAIALLLLLALSAEVEAATFGCEIRIGTTCLSNQTLLIRLNSSEAGQAPNNSHAQLANYSGGLYNYSVCCWTDAFRTMGNACTGNGYAVLRLANTSDSHVQANSQSGYPWSACFNVTAGDVECEYPVDACSSGYSAVVSIASSESASSNLTNAHVADFNLYTRKVCCRIGGLTPPTVAFADLTPINVTKRSDLTCENGTVTDADGDTVTLHYNWYVNQTSITVLNLPMDYDDTVTVNNTHDISGYANHGTVQGATFLPTGGQVGGGFRFDGTDDYISLPNDPELNFSTGGFSISVWAKRTAGAGVIIDKKNGTSIAPGFALISHATFVRFYVSDGVTTEGVSTEDPLSSSAYTHIVAVRNSAGLHIYYDGTLAASSAAGGALNVNSQIAPAIGANASLLDYYFNGELDELIIFNRSLTAGEVKTLYESNNKILNRTEFFKTEDWNCSITPVDSTGLNGSTVFSNQSRVNASAPLAVTLLYPANNNQSVFERYVNFSWTTADEPDGEAVNYTLNVTVAPGVCAIESVRTVTTTNYTYGELCVDQLYNWTVRACDIDGCATSSTFNFTIASVVSYTLVNNNTNFGELENLESKTTDNYAVQPFLLRNDGNVYLNISILGNNSPFSSVGLDDAAFQYKAADNETGSINTSGSQTTYTPVTASYTHAVKQLNYSDASDVAAIHINITVPVNEPPGYKHANVTFQAVNP